ncbi:Amidinotransferase family protein [Leishmania donovani]|uniref:Amidinotransferase family protein n=1 Tax=Leishmania donovani TaxID=5661 RepID=A0A504Y1Q1_LEIDO|nr:Amidinotransferase family protein [Leishmania donovani]
MTKLTVVCRAVSSALEKQTCELTCIERQTISLEAVRKQHKAYVQVFKEMIEDGYDIELIELPALNELPDSMFVEDVSMIYNTCAVITRPGAPSRRPEVDPILDTVTALRQENYRICEPGTVDGGDVLYVANSKYVFVGKSTRSNDSGYEQMKEYLGKHGLECVQCVVKNCLHLNTLLLSPKWVDPEIFTSRGFKVVEVDSNEPAGANVLSFSAEKNGKPLRTIGRPTRQVVLEADEIAKAEGSLTCCSLLSYSA